MDSVDKIIMCATVMKSANSTTGYSCILSDDSIDRESEIVGKTLLEGALDNEYTPALMDHENKVLNHVAQWTNKRMETIDGHSALVAEPKFFLSNPNAKILKGMLDEGAQLSISISAIPKKHEMVKINGQEYKMYTEGELLEASFVGVPANKHARVMQQKALAIAKSLNLDKEMSKGEKFDSCVKQVMADGKDRESAESICASKCKIGPVGADDTRYSECVQQMLSSGMTQAQALRHCSKKSLGATAPEEKMTEEEKKPNAPADGGEAAAPAPEAGVEENKQEVPAEPEKTPEAGKSIDIDALERKIEAKIKSGISDSPVFKHIADQMPEAQQKVAKTKAQEAVEKKMLPVI